MVKFVGAGRLVVLGRTIGTSLLFLDPGAGEAFREPGAEILGPGAGETFREPGAEILG